MRAYMYSPTIEKSISIVVDMFSRLDMEQQEAVLGMFLGAVGIATGKDAFCEFFSRIDEERLALEAAVHDRIAGLRGNERDFAHSVIKHAAESIDRDVKKSPPDGNLTGAEHSTTTKNVPAESIAHSREADKHCLHIFNRGGVKNGLF